MPIEGGEIDYTHPEVAPPRENGNETGNRAAWEAWPDPTGGRPHGGALP